MYHTLHSSHNALWLVYSFINFCDSTAYPKILIFFGGGGTDIHSCLVLFGHLLLYLESVKQLFKAHHGYWD